MKSFVTCVVVTILVLPGLAQAFTSRKGARVNPVNADVFEVVSKSGGSGFDYWCGAGDYARRQLKSPWGATLFISRGLGASETTNRRSAVQFTLNPALAGGHPTGNYLSINSLKPGDNMSVQSAMNYCNQLPVGF